MATDDMRVAWITAALVTVALAGCTSDDGDEGPGSDIGNGPTNDGLLVPLLAVSTAIENLTLSESGTLSHAEAFCVPQCGGHDYSVTAVMQEDTAYFLEAYLYQTSNPASGSPVFFRLEGNAGIRDYGGPEYEFAPAGDTTVGTITATLLGRSDSEISIHVGTNVVVDATPPSYTLEATLIPIPDRIPQYGAAAVTVPEGGRLVGESHTGPGRMMLFDGRDEFVDIINVDGPTVLVENVTARTEFAVITMDDIWSSLYVEQTIDDPTPVLRNLGVVGTFYELGAINGGGPQTFTFDVPTAVSQIGYRYGTPSCNDPNDCYVVSNGESALVDPEGNTVATITTQLCICGGYQSGGSGIDLGPYPAGTYTIEWDSDETQGPDLQAYTFHYQR